MLCEQSINEFLHEYKNINIYYIITAFKFKSPFQ